MTKKTDIVAPTPDEARYILARQNLRHWCKLIQPDFEAPPHILKLCEALEEIERGDLRNLMICMPPRHGKSTVAAIAFPSWFLGKHPDWQVMLSSFGADLAEDHSRKARNAIAAYGDPVFGVKLSQDTTAVDKWALHGRRGIFNAVGVGGAVTGRGGQLLVADDLIKNSEEAASELIREKAWVYFNEDWKSRRVNIGMKAAMVVIGTRWHEDDVIGRLLAEEKRGGMQWEKLIMPLVDDSGEFTEADGPILWPKIMSREDVNDLRRRDQSFQALYQQRPTAPGGNIFKRGHFRFYVDEPWKRKDSGGDRIRWFDKVVISADCAFKDAQGSDLVAIHVWAARGPDRYLIDRRSDRMGFERTCSEILALRAKWPEARTVYVEDKANGTAVVEILRKKISGVIPVKPEGGKEARAHAVAPQVESQNVYLPDPGVAGWSTDVLAQLCSFPFAPHDDDVDAMTQALLKLYKSGGWWDGLGGAGSGGGGSDPWGDDRGGSGDGWLRRM